MMQERLTLRNFWRILYKRWFIWLILIVVMSVGGYVHGIKTYVPTYTATTKVLVAHKTAILKPTEVRTKASKVKRIYVSYKANDQELLSTYKELMTTPKMINKLQKSLSKIKGYNYSKAQLERNLNLSSQDSSLIIHFDATAQSENMAKKIADQAAKVFSQNINTFTDAGKLKTVSKAKDNLVIKSESNVKKETTFGLLTGIYVSLLLALLWLAVGKGLKHIIK